MQRYDEFCAAVTRALRDATAGERAAVGRELREHLEDHAAALIEGGMDAEDAASAAVDAMGDPGEIGRALNRAYPHRWYVLRVCSALFLGFFLLVTAVPTLVSLSALYNRADSIRDARMTFHMSASARPYELTAPLGTQTLRLYGIEDNLDSVELYFSIYNRSPTQPSAYDAISEHLKFFLPDGTSLGSSFQSVSAYASRSANAFAIVVSLPEDADTIIMRYDRYGYSFSETIARDAEFTAKGGVLHAP